MNCPRAILPPCRRPAGGRANAADYFDLREPAYARLYDTGNPFLTVFRRSGAAAASSLSAT